MRPQLLVATLAVLLLAVFLAAWVFTLPNAPDPPFPARARAAPTPTPQPPQPPTPAAPRPQPTPAPTLAPTPAPTPTHPPMPTPTPRPTPTPTPQPTPAPTLAPTPAPAALFLQVHQPDNYAEVRAPYVVVSASTLPWLITKIRRQSSGEQPDQDFIVRADASGDFSARVPLAEGVNVIAITTYHGVSPQTVRRFLAVTYDPALAPSPTPVPLFLTLSAPKDGAAVSERILVVSGATAPDAEVVLQDAIPVKPDEMGQWQASIVLKPGLNKISALALRGAETVPADAITVTYNPDP